MGKMIFRKSLLLENTGVGTEFYTEPSGWENDIDGKEVFERESGGYYAAADNGTTYGVSKRWIEEQE